MTSPVYWHDAVVYLSAQDQTLAGLITLYPDAILINHHNPFSTLTRAIVGQQISVKAADAVWQRLSTLLGCISPEHYLAFTEEELRGCGLSWQKISYITNIAMAFEQESLNPNDWQIMDDEAVVKQLTAIKGIGIWSDQMFLIFHLQRPDILPLADSGLINAIHRYLWRSLDPVAVQY